MKTIDINQIDLRYEDLRLKDKHQEGLLLHSISEQGIREPLGGIICDENRFILLDGFKRYRCGIKLCLPTMPYVCLASDERSGLLQLIRTSNNKSLHILEQACLVDQLHQGLGMSTSELAHRLERSPAWVHVRLGILNEMSETVKQEIFTGRFPARSYMYSLRQLTRVDKVKKSEVDEFVKAISGKRLSTRNIDRLAHGYFKGGPSLSEQIRKGNISWTLDQLKGRDKAQESPQIGDKENRVLLDLEITQKYMRRVVYKLGDNNLDQEGFLVQAHLLVEGILSRIEVFIQALKNFLKKGQTHLKTKKEKR